MILGIKWGVTDKGVVTVVIIQKRGEEGRQREDENEWVGECCECCVDVAFSLQLFAFRFLLFFFYSDQMTVPQVGESEKMGPGTEKETKETKLEETNRDEMTEEQCRSDNG